MNVKRRISCARELAFGNKTAKLPKVVAPSVLFAARGSMILGIFDGGTPGNERVSQGAKSMNNEVARMQIADMNIHKSYAVVIPEVDHRIMTTIRRLEQGLRLAGLCLIEECR
jgi:hypothetical protein